ncbi:MAG: metallophosphoesterase [Spirochaetales bacterium]|nr:metallophosphoesterase [Spirochaetales bacterium]
MERNKIIILSDIHLSNALENSWFDYARAPLLINFLTSIALRREVKELVLLGDVFDLWLFPLEEPPMSIDEIIRKWDPTVIHALKLCIANLPDVYYIPGNHDMSVTSEDLKSIHSNGKHLQWITHEDYNKKYRVDGKNLVHLEHGNSVDLLNAPYEGADGLYGLPIGYFLTRMYATIQSHIKKRESVESRQNKVIQKIGNRIRSEMKKNLLYHHKKYISTEDSEIGSLFIKSMIDIQFIIAHQQGKQLTDNTIITFKDPGKNITIGQLKEHYHQLLPIWFKKWGIELLNTLLVSLHPDGLRWYSRILAGEGKGKAIVMGHTHKIEWNYLFNRNYSNDGTWCSKTKDKYPSYSEIVIHPQSIETSLWQWDGFYSKKRGSRKAAY